MVFYTQKGVQNFFRTGTGTWSTTKNAKIIVKF